MAANKACSAKSSRAWTRRPRRSYALRDLPRNIGPTSTLQQTTMAPSDDKPTNPSRAEFHQANQARAEAEAQRLLAAKTELGGRWLAWVAAELYALKPAAYAQMVRRELQRLNAD